MGEIENHEKEIYFEAAGIKNPERQEAYLNLACGDDHDLRNRVQALLDANIAAGTFLDSSPIESVINSDGRDDPTISAGDRLVGSYKLLEKIGEGGFGEVYMAEQSQPIQRRVAVKIIKPGMDSKQVIARFEAERQALALMDHSNIARIFDAGETENGRPYFVMELVRGIPITEYCDDRSLPTNERLQLFVEICSAIQHAHQKGIIHRDIKPNNILVYNNGDRPVPKIIDFGIAKATQGRLTDKTLFTQFRQFIGTPAYMSPEQAQMNGVDIDTRSDVYSLGVLLYELLTGKTPLNSQDIIESGFEEICRRIREDDPLTPSKKISSLQQVEVTTLAKNRRTDPAQFHASIRGDLDWIVMKAVEKDRTRRYSTTDALAQDVTRYLQGEPVTAVPPSSWYLLRKALARHRTLFLTASSIAGTLLIAALVSSWLAWRLNSEVEQKTKAIAAALQAKDISENEKLRAERIGYASEMSNASQALMSRNVGLARSYLERQAESGNATLRHWEWPILSELCRGDQSLQFSSHGDVIETICVSPDGTWASTGSGRGDVRVWNLKNGELLRTLVDNRSDEAVFGLVITTSGDRLCAMTRKGLLKSWFLPTFKTTEQQCEITGPMRNFALSHDATHVAIGEDQSVTLWELSSDRSPQQVAHMDGTDSGGHNVTFSPNDQRLAIGGNNLIRIVDATSLAEQTTLPRGGGFDMEFSPDGTVLASSPRFRSRHIDLYRVSDWKHLGQLDGHTGVIWAIDFSPDGKQIASAGADTTVRVWDVGSMSEQAVLTGHVNEVGSVEFTPDGEQLISGGKGDICIFDLERSQSRLPIVAKSAVPGFWHRMFSQASYSRDGRWLAIRNSDSTASLRSPKTLVEEVLLSSLGKNVRGVRFSPADDVLAVGYLDGHLSVHATNEIVNPESKDIIGRCKLLESGQVAPVRFSADGKRLLVVVQPEGSLDSEDGETTYFVWSVEQNRTIQSWTISGPDECADLSPNGETVVTGHGDGSVRFWSVADPRKSVDVAFDMGVLSVAFSPDSCHVAVGNTGLHLVDATTRQISSSMTLKSNVHSIDFSPDGRRIATGGGDDANALTIWDVETRQPLLTLPTPGFSFRQVEFAPDQSAVMLIGGGGDLNVWQTRP